jgi:hypothetical protein
MMDVLIDSSLPRGSSCPFAEFAEVCIGCSLDLSALLRSVGVQDADGVLGLMLARARGDV